jgi:predicted CoA-substrate-specific enzyme activase
MSGDRSGDTSGVSVGVDVGSTAVKLVALDASGARLVTRVEPTEPRMDLQTARLLAELRHDLGPLPFRSVVATGYGRQRVADATRRITEITAHALGLGQLGGAPGTLIDIGGQDTKVIVVGATGAVTRFAMNDKCAAGTGRFLEMTAARLRLSVEELGTLALSATREAAISSTCTVFAESELISALADGEELPALTRGLCRALVQRVAALARGVGLLPPFHLSGGVALNPAVEVMLREALDPSLRVVSQPQLLGALGAAVAGRA